MQVIKFVTEDFKSPVSYKKLDYSNFGIPIEEEVDTKEKGQYGKGIYVIPINEDVDLEDVLFTGTMILLEVAEEDIVYCKHNRAMRVRKAIPIKQIVETDKEWKIIRTAACKNPEWAYDYAIGADKGSVDETRTAACKDPEFAYWYALYVDRNPTAETRTAVCKDSEYAYWYAMEVDQKPRKDTRIAACHDPGYAYEYARDVDKKPTEETRIGASKDKSCKEQYELWEKAQCK
jgi:hypothetical protein